MQAGTTVEIVGDAIGNNSGFTVADFIGKRGTLQQGPTVGFWWVNLPDGNSVLVSDSEIKEVQ